jgi:hypothetical protein
VFDEEKRFRHPSSPSSRRSNFPCSSYQEMGRARCSVSTSDLLRSVTDKVRTSHLPFVFRVPFFPSEAFFDASEVDRVFSGCHPYSARAYLIVQFSARRFERGKPRTTTLWTVHPPWNFFPSIFGNMERSFGLFSTLKSKKSSTHNKDMC